MSLYLSTRLCCLSKRITILNTSNTKSTLDPDSYESDSLFKKLFNFYIYSSLHIALGATLFTAEAYWTFNLEVDYYYLLLVFSGTLLIYSLHRIIGIRKLNHIQDSGRFRVIREYRSHMIFYSLLSVIALLWALWHLGMDTLWKLSAAGIISLAYVIPFFGEGKRLRDFNYIKIILIAVVWAYISILPLLGEVSIHILGMITLERFLFIFAITLPFDIRDLAIDNTSRLITIPKMIGNKNTYRLCTACMVVGLLALALASKLSGAENFYKHSYLIFIIYLMTFGIIRLTKGKSSDYYYSGLLDGTLVLRGIMLWCYISVL